MDFPRNIAQEYDEPYQDDDLQTVEKEMEGLGLYEKLEHKNWRVIQSFLLINSDSKCRLSRADRDYEHEKPRRADP